MYLRTVAEKEMILESASPIDVLVVITPIITPILNPAEAQNNTLGTDGRPIDS